MNDALIIFDRDGVLNKLLVDPVTGLTDSPMNISQIEILPWVKEQLKILHSMKYNFVIATNQPSAAKKKTTLYNLMDIHYEIVNRLEDDDIYFLNSFICFHRAEDNCNCRKPKTGLLESALKQFPSNKKYSWMVGDRATDIIAGNSIGINTALLSSIEELNKLKELNITPTYYGSDLRDFTSYLKEFSNG